MSEIALYNALTKLGLDHDEAKEAVADIASAKDVATKVDLANLETRLTQRIYAAVGIILAGIGLMIKFL